MNARHVITAYTESRHDGRKGRRHTVHDEPYCLCSAEAGVRMQCIGTARRPSLPLVDPQFPQFGGSTNTRAVRQRSEGNGGRQEGKGQD